ncbi:MAG: ectoine utilization protein EutC [Limibacillus sp.]
MADIKILTEADLRQAVALDLDAVDMVEQAFEALATKAVVMPPILRLDIAENNGEVDVKTAYVPGIDSFAIKMSPGFFDNPKLGLPSLNGLMILFSAKTGLVEALLLDNGYLTDVRTAAAGAVAARHLSREDSTVAAVLGAGVQAELQLKALMLVRPIAEARLWARDAAKMAALAQRLSGELGITVTAYQEAQAAVSGADVVVTTTPATSPILMNQWVGPGQHITAMGSDAEHKNEVEPALVARADLYVADSLAQTRRLGELHHALEARALAPEAAKAELGAVIAGKTAGRTSAEQVTLSDLTGTGVQDTAIATLAFKRALAAGAGSDFSS